MKIDISYIPIGCYSKRNISQWFFMLKRYKYVKGIIIRIFGIYINVREEKATEKLLKRILK